MPEQTEEMKSELLDEPNIINYYGLRSNPLEPEEPFYFFTSHLTKSLKLFTYLTSFSNKIIITTAPEGAGKTAFFEQFEKSQSDKKIICKIKALRFDTPSQLLHELAEQLDLNVKDSIGRVKLIESLRTCAEKVADEERVIIVLIEEAHVLNDAVIEALFQLVEHEPDARSGIKLILSAEPQVENIDFVETVEQISDKTKGKRDLFFHALHPFTLEECQHYLQTCFDRQGDLDKIPFSEVDYAHVHQKSGGFPQKINAEAIKIMEQGLNRLIVEKQGPRWMLASAVAICLAAGVLVTAYLWDSQPVTVAGPIAQLTDEPKPGKVLGSIQRDPVVTVTSDKSAHEAGNMQSVAMKSIDENSNINSQPISIEKTIPALDHQIKPVEPLAQVIDEPVMSASLPENEQQTTDADLNKTNGSIQVNDAVAVMLPPTLEPQVVIEQVSEPTAKMANGALEKRAESVNHEQAIMSFSPTDYTMQMLGSKTREGVARFMESFPEIKEFRYFETVNKGEPWFVVIFGRYQTRAEALAAAENLPASLSKQKPWIRRLSGIQNSIKTHTGSN